MVENDSRVVNERLTLLENSEEWNDYLSSDEALEDEKKRLVEQEPTYLEKKPDYSKLKLPINLFLIMFIVSLVRWNGASSFGMEASFNSVFRDGEYYRLLSSLFIHADMAHLLGNGWLFIVFGFLLSNYYGYLVFPTVSIICGILTTAVTIYFYPPTTRLLGASGMIYSMVAIWLVFFLRYDTRYSFFIRLVRATAFILVMLFPSEIKPRTSYSAHAFGFLIGLVSAILMLPYVEKSFLTPRKL